MLTHALCSYFWGYFEPIRQHMPQNCSADVEAVISHVDQVLSNGTSSEKSALKDLFGLSTVTHDDDAAGALRNNLWDWQSLSVSVQLSNGKWSFRQKCRPMSDRVLYFSSFVTH